MELYEMADLPIAVATADILEIVTGTVINAVLWLNMKPEAAVQRLYDILKEAQQEKEDERGRT